MYNRQVTTNALVDRSLDSPGQNDEMWHLL